MALKSWVVENFNMFRTVHRSVADDKVYRTCRKARNTFTPISNEVNPRDSPQKTYMALRAVRIVG